MLLLTWFVMKTRRAKQGKELAQGPSCGVVETGDRYPVVHLTRGRSYCSELNGRVKDHGVFVLLWGSVCLRVSWVTSPRCRCLCFRPQLGGVQGMWKLTDVVLHFYHICIFIVAMSDQIISPILQIRQIIREDKCFAWADKTQNETARISRLRKTMDSPSLPTAWSAASALCALIFHTRWKEGDNLPGPRSL